MFKMSAQPTPVKDILFGDKTKAWITATMQDAPAIHGSSCVYNLSNPWFNAFRCSTPIMADILGTSNEKEECRKPGFCAHAANVTAHLPYLAIDFVQR